MAIGITCAAPPQADIGAAYSHLFPVTGDTPPDVFTISVGALPAGLTINAGTGLVSGTPTGPPGVSSFTVDVVDSVPSEATAACSIKVNAGLVLTTGNAPNGYLGLPYSHGWIATGGLPPITFQIQSGALPNGLTLNITTGVISGTPLVLGLFNFTIRATDSLGTTSDVTFGLWIRPAAESPATSSNIGTSCGGC